MIHHRGVMASVFAVVLAAWATGGVAFAQVTPPLLATLRERAPAIDGTCIAGATVQPR